MRNELKVSFVVLMKQLLEAPKNEGWFTGEPSLPLEGWDFHSYSRPPSGGEGLEVESIPNVND